MIVITGGVFQHKLDFIYNKFSLSYKDVCFAGKSDENGKKVIYKFNYFIDKWLKSERDVENETKEFIQNHKNFIIVIDQNGCGITPIDINDIVLREETGKAGCILAKNADEVYDVRFGLGIKIK